MHKYLRNISKKINMFNFHQHEEGVEAMIKVVTTSKNLWPKISSHKHFMSCHLKEATHLPTGVENVSRCPWFGDWSHWNPVVPWSSGTETSIISTISYHKCSETFSSRYLLIITILTLMTIFLALRSWQSVF